MNNAQIIDEAFLSSLGRTAAESPRGRKNFNFHASDEDACHRLLNAMEPRTYVQPHRHLAANKDETFVAVRGRLGVALFDDAGTVVGRTILAPGGAAVAINIPHGMFHAIVALEPGSVFFEAKGGPYRPLTTEEKAAWAPPEGAPEAGAYLQRLMALFRQ